MTMSKGLNAYRRIFPKKIVHLESPYAKLDIIKKILESTQNTGAHERLLTYGSYVSYLQVDEYLTAMVLTGLVRFERESGSYRITAKGIDFLTSLRHMDYLIKFAEL